MKATIESTTAVVEMQDQHGRPFAARVWQGATERGVEFTAYISIVQVRREDDTAQFDAELRESPAPGPTTQRAIDRRFII
jgi:hypothetical protein